MFSARSITADEFEAFTTHFEGERTFLHSAAYADYRQQCGERVLMEGYYQDQKLVAVALIQVLQSKLKNWLHVPHGPLVKAENATPFWKWWLPYYHHKGLEMRLDLVRVSPLTSPNTSIDFKAADFKPAAIHLVNPEHSWVLGISEDTETLLANLKKSTRYEVRKGLKPETGFRITIDHNLDAFWGLHEATVARQGFVPFTRKSTEAELRAFGDNCQIITVWHEDQALASGVFLFDDHAGYYHQGASVPSKLPAAHAYIWAAIMEAKRRGCSEFNFWGVCAEDAINHPWYGLSKFKRGFGGEDRLYLHVHDCELTWKAKLNRLLEAQRRKKRGY